MDIRDKKQEVGERIAEAGFNLFRQYGVRAITLDEIALQLGISKKTIYEHFAGKDELVTEVLRQRLVQSKDQFEDSTSKAKDAVEANMLMMQFLDNMFINMNPIVLVDLQKYHPGAFRLFHEHMYGFVLDRMKHNILRGIKEGLYREDTDVEIMARFRIESCNLCFKPGIFPKDHFEMSRVQRQLLEHFLFGIATEKGHKIILKYREKILNKNN
ncbi:MAG: TetR/AcrR family transcriptional regulator [Chitinophagaceae bacterium]|nr:MAG: TetR/AcrR family transcriptional regulator [Chitinophagaceae bacterium]